MDSFLKILDDEKDDPGRSHFSPGASHEIVTADSQGADSTTVLAAPLLFHAEFKRTGDDLRLIGSDGKIHVIAGYFKSEHPLALLTPDGAMLSGEIVAALAGPAAPGKDAARRRPAPAT